MEEKGHSGGVQISPNQYSILGHNPTNTFICQVLEGLDYSEEEDECPEEGIHD
jgi:hypothetical protein